MSQIGMTFNVRNVSFLSAKAHYIYGLLLLLVNTKGRFGNFREVERPQPRSQSSSREIKREVTGRAEALSVERISKIPRDRPQVSRFL